MASILAPNMHFAKTGSYSVVEPGKPKKRPHPRRAAAPALSVRHAPGVDRKQMKGRPADESRRPWAQRLRAELAIAEKANAASTEHNIDRKLFAKRC